MKKTLLLFAVIAVAATALSFGVARWVAARYQPAPTTANLHDPAWLKNALGLNDQQAREVESLESGFRKELNSSCATHCAARMELGDELAKAKPDVEKCRGCVEKMNGVQADAERATLAHILKVRALLDEAQAQRYSTLIRDQVCNMPMGAP
jgi:hypothetical protein